MEQKELKINIHLDILLIVSNFQNQNGLRINDYYRYSKFCRKKINKLRKLFKLTQGKRKFGKVDITPQEVFDTRVLLIPILDSERKWGYGMYLKQQLTNYGEDIKQLRYNIKKKFKRSAQVAKALLELCQASGDTQTILEAEAYYDTQNANYLMFKRKFEESLELLKKATKIYDNLMKLKDTIESLAYIEKLNAIKKMIRLCIYNLNVFSF
jgi:signal recognition particle subunit SRP68